MRTLAFLGLLLVFVSGCSAADAAKWFFVPHQGGWHCPAETGFNCVGRLIEWPALGVAGLLSVFSLFNASGQP